MPKKIIEFTKKIKWKNMSQDYKKNLDHMVLTQFVKDLVEVEKAFLSGKNVKENSAIYYNFKEYWNSKVIVNWWNFEDWKYIKDAFINNNDEVKREGEQKVIERLKKLGAKNV